MRQTAARPLAVLVLAVLAVHSASAQDAADYDIDGIRYYFAAGSHTSGHLSLGLDHDGTNQTDFHGCAHMILRDKPEKNDVGRMQVIGKMGGQFITFNLNSFHGTHEDMDGGIAQDVYVDGSHTHVGQIQHPAVLAGVAGWGVGTLDMGRQPYHDPVTGKEEFVASMFVTGQGFRDDTTGAIYDADGGPWVPGEPARRGSDDWEVHLRVESPADYIQPDAVFTTTQPEGDNPYFMPSEAYSDGWVFDNLRFGGTATIRLSAEALAQPGDNALTFVFRDPAGKTLDSVTLEPSLMAPESHTAEVPLDQFGRYSMVVNGKVALSSYTFSLTQHTPAAFDMDFWWDNTTFGRESTQTLWDCQDAVGYPEELVVNVVERVPPPPFAWVPVGVALSASVLGVLIGGTMIYMSATRRT